jgi:hypothetical protein
MVLGRYRIWIAFFQRKSEPFSSMHVVQNPDDWVNACWICGTRTTFHFWVLSDPRYPQEE